MVLAADIDVMSGYDGTQVGPDGKRYPEGEVPDLSRAERLPAIVRAVGTPDPGEAPVIREDGIAEWGEVATGGEGVDIGAAEDVTFDDSGLVWVSGATNVQQALAALDGIADTNADGLSSLDQRVDDLEGAPAPTADLPMQVFVQYTGTISQDGALQALDPVVSQNPRMINTDGKATWDAVNGGIVLTNNNKWYTIEYILTLQGTNVGNTRVNLYRSSDEGQSASASAPYNALSMTFKTNAFGHPAIVWRPHVRCPTSPASANYDCKVFITQLPA